MPDTSTVTCTRRFQFCAGHRVMGHENKCAHLHGHNYVALVTAHAQTDSVGRVIDFSVMKERLGSWIDDHWDHGFILHEQDAEAEKALGYMTPNGRDQKIHRLPYNPTAENMARYLAEVVFPTVMPDHIDCTHVELWETENCKAEWHA
jgi:6-pyruvoyltetrahydropterin/6-carboxytetrahydropterin synthase